MILAYHIFLGIGFGVLSMGVVWYVVHRIVARWQPIPWDAASGRVAFLRQIPRPYRAILWIETIGLVGISIGLSVIHFHMPHRTDVLGFWFWLIFNEGYAAHEMWYRARCATYNNKVHDE